MKCSASLVMITFTSYPCLVKTLAISTALWAAMEPVTPRMILKSMLAPFILWQVGPAVPHFFRVHDRLHSAPILQDRRAHDEIIKVFPLGYFLARYAQP